MPFPSLFTLTHFSSVSLYTFLVLMQPRVCARMNSERQTDRQTHTHTKPSEASQETMTALRNRPAAPGYPRRLRDLVITQTLTRYLTLLVITPRNHHLRLSLTCPSAAHIHAQVSYISVASTRTTWNTAHLWYECVRGTSRQKGAVFILGLQFDVLVD